MSRLLAVLLLLMFGLPSALANFAGVWGGAIGEATGLEQIYIVREKLTIDMRGADGSRPEFLSKQGSWPMAFVEVIYELDNAGKERTTDLVFISGGSHFNVGDDVEASLNGAKLPLKESKREDKRWQVPETTPSTSTASPLPFSGSSRTNPFEVRITFPAGKSTLQLTYRTFLTSDFQAANPTNFWQFAYILAPARMWAGFGGLDVQVLAPLGWLAATEPQLQREGDVLIGSFNQIPADALTITVQMPPEPFRDRMAKAEWIAGILTALVVPIVLLLTWLVGRYLGNRKRQNPSNFEWYSPRLAAVAISLSWPAVAVYLAYLWVMLPYDFAHIPWLQRGLPNSSGMSGRWLVKSVFAAPLAFVVGVIATAFFANWYGKGNRLP